VRYAEKVAQALLTEAGRRSHWPSFRSVLVAIDGALRILRFQLPCPPSMNAYWRSLRSGPLAGRVLLSKEGRAYRGLVAAALAAQAVPLDSIARPVRIQIELRHRRRVDLDNYVKPLLDALKARPKDGLSGVILDDRFVDDLHITRGPRPDDPAGEAYVELTALDRESS